MTIPSITPFPGTLPQRSDPTNFPANADAFVTWQEGTLAPELAATVTAMNADIAAFRDRFVSVIEYGAVGDGTTDDTAAIQDALDTGKDVFVPGVTAYYKLTAALTLVDGQRIYGEGERSELRQATTLLNVISATSKSYVSIEKLHLYCAGDWTTLTNGCAVLLTTCSKAKVVDCVVENHRGWGVTLSGTNDSTVSGNTFINAPTSGITDDTDICGDIQAVYSSSRNVIEKNHCISGSGTGIKIQSVVNGETCDDNVIVGNVIKNAKIYGICVYRNAQVIGDVPLQSVSHTVVADNLIDNVTGGVLNSVTSTYTYGCGIYLQGAENTTVTGNSVKDAHSATVTFANTLAPGAIGITNLSRAVITGNTVTGAGANGIDLSDANVFGDSLEGLVIAGNSIIDSALRGIRVRTSNNVVLSGNVINSTGSNAIEVNLATTVTNYDYVIAGNLIKNVTGSGITCGYVDSLSITGNSIKTTSSNGITAANSNDVAIRSNSIIDHTLRGIQIVSTCTGSVVVSDNLSSGTGSSTEGVRLDALCSVVNSNSVAGCTTPWAGTFAVLRGTQSWTAVGNVGTGEDDLNTFALPAGALAVNDDTVEYVAWGTTVNNANAKTLKAYFGSQLICTTALTVSQVSPWRLQAAIIRTGATTQRYMCQVVQGGTVMQSDVEVGTAAETLSGAITIKLTGEATTNNDVQQLGQIVKILKG